MKCRYRKAPVGIPLGLRSKKAKRMRGGSTIRPAPSQANTPMIQRATIPPVVRNPTTRVVRDPAGMPAGTIVYQHPDGLEVYCMPHNRTMLRLRSPFGSGED
jgi:hypothetical protein